MSKKFTGITSAGSAIPVYDKDAHEALSSKLDTSAFSSVSGEFATVDDVVAAVSGKADTSAIPSLDGYATTEDVISATSGLQPSGDYATNSAVAAALSGKADTTALNGYLTKASGDNFYVQNTPYQITAGPTNGSGGAPVFTVNPGGLYAGGAGFKVLSATPNSLTVGDPNYMILSANQGGFHYSGQAAEISAYGNLGIKVPGNVGISAGTNADGKFDIVAPGSFSVSGDKYAVSASNSGISFSSVSAAGFSATSSGISFSCNNPYIGSATLTSANNNQIISPKFEVLNASGAGFSIEASGAKGYDNSGNVTWDTSNPPAPTQLIAGSDNPKPSILLSPYMPKSYSAQFSSAPLLSADGNGLYIGISSSNNLYASMNGITAAYGPTASYPNIKIQPDRITTVNPNSNTSARVGTDGIAFYAGSSAWSLTESVQKSEIACDSATSAITAIAGSAIGGGGGATYSAGANIDITNDVISGKDWSEDIAGATSGLMETSGLEYDGDKISGYMGSAFAGGGDVPEGVMVESAVGYNAVNEISGYNGSAIAQYGAEKQWLVHDDTLVHAANSAQYALGVNLSAVAQLLGVDETVLWSGDAISGISASESMTGFNRIRIKYSTNTNSTIIYGSVHEYKEIDPSTLDHDFTIGAITNNGSNSTNNMLFINTEYSATSNYTVLNMVHSYQLYNNAGTWTTGTNNRIRIKELVGIGRKS